jgi:hypothetical protein
MPEPMERQDVAKLLKRVHKVLFDVLNISEPALITPQSMQVLLDLYVKPLLKSVRQEREEVLLRDWEKRRVMFRKQWLASPYTDSVQFRRTKHIVLTEASADDTNRKCKRKKGPDYPVQ